MNHAYYTLARELLETKRQLDRFEQLKREAELRFAACNQTYNELANAIEKLGYSAVDALEMAQNEADE